MEIICVVYSEIDGSKIQTWNISQQELGKQEYVRRRLNNEEVGYFEGIVFPLDDIRYKYNKIKKGFEVKTDRELINDGVLILKQTQKLVNDTIMNKELYELYQENLVLIKNHEKVYKINKSNLLKRKNILELIEINFDESEIKKGILEKFVYMLDSKSNELLKKYPQFEISNFGYKTSMAHLWNGLTEPAKLRILRSPSRINSFNIIISEFYSELSDDEKNNPDVLLIKMNDLVSLIIENEMLYKAKHEELLIARNEFTKKIRELIISKDSVINIIKEINDFFGDERIIVEEMELSYIYYNTIPLPDMDFLK
jgi:hypothetical protein